VIGTDSRDIPASDWYNNDHPVPPGKHAHPPPQLVRVRRGAYFFLPGIALRSLAR
jgi:hypothetical protein